jgi:uncharacterized protein
MTVEHVETDGEGRFFVRMEGDEADLTYTRIGPHQSARGHGVAEALAEAAFAYAREHGDRVVPSCPFVRKWLQRHPEQWKLLDPPFAESLERHARP